MSSFGRTSKERTLQKVFVYRHSAVQWVSPSTSLFVCSVPRKRGCRSPFKWQHTSTNQPPSCSVAKWSTPKRFPVPLRPPTWATTKSNSKFGASLEPTGALSNSFASPVRSCGRSWRSPRCGSRPWRPACWHWKGPRGSFWGEGKGGHVGEPVEESMGKAWEALQ